MDVLPSREKGHLTVAAMRLLIHRAGSAPRPAEIAELLGWGEEETLVVLRGLADQGVVRMHETPFDLRVEIEAYPKLEDLPLEAEKGELQEEVEEFQRESRTRHEKLDQLFGSDEMERRRKERSDTLEKEFAKFRKGKPHPPDAAT